LCVIEHLYGQLSSSVLEVFETSKQLSSYDKFIRNLDAKHHYIAIKLQLGDKKHEDCEVVDIVKSVEVLFLTEMQYEKSALQMLVEFSAKALRLGYTFPPALPSSNPNLDQRVDVDLWSENTLSSGQ
jgi:hypothetical protein